MKKEKENVFRVGDRVWHPVYKYGHIESFYRVCYSMARVYFDSGIYRWVEEDILSFTPYEVNANQTRQIGVSEGDSFWKEVADLREGVQVSECLDLPPMVGDIGIFYDNLEDMRNSVSECRFSVRTLFSINKKRDSKFLDSYYWYDNFFKVSENETIAEIKERFLKETENTI